MSLILAIDPGTTKSGWCIYDSVHKTVKSSSVINNTDIRRELRTGGFIYVNHLAIETFASYGMPVGKEVFETCIWIGRFIESWRAPNEVKLIYRRDVKLHLCGSMKAKDPNVWQALIDKLGPVGTKAEPGPLYGVKSHARSAVAVAVTAAETVPIFEGAMEE